MSNFRIQIFSETREKDISFGRRTLGEIGRDILGIKIALGLIVVSGDGESGELGHGDSPSTPNPVPFDDQKWFDCSTGLKADMLTASTFDKSMESALMKYQLDNQFLIICYLFEKYGVKNIIGETRRIKGEVTGDNLRSQGSDRDAMYDPDSQDNAYSSATLRQIEAALILFDEEFSTLGEATLAIMHGWRPHSSFKNKGYAHAQAPDDEARIGSKVIDIVPEVIYDDFVTNKYSQTKQDLVDSGYIDSIIDAQPGPNEYMMRVYRATALSTASWIVNGAPEFNYGYILYKRVTELQSILFNAATTVMSLPEYDDSTGALMPSDERVQRMQRMFYPDPFTNPAPFFIGTYEIGYFYETNFVLDAAGPLPNNDPETIRELEEKALQDILKFYNKPDVWWHDVEDELFSIPYFQGQAVPLANHAGQVYPPSESVSLENKYKNLEFAGRHIALQKHKEDLKKARAALDGFGWQYFDDYDAEEERDLAKREIEARKLEISLIDFTEIKSKNYWVVSTPSVITRLGSSSPPIAQSWRELETSSPTPPLIEFQEYRTPPLRPGVKYRAFFRINKEKLDLIKDSNGDRLTRQASSRYTSTSRMPEIVNGEVCTPPDREDSLRTYQEYQAHAVKKRREISRKFRDASAQAAMSGSRGQNVDLGEFGPFDLNAADPFGLSELNGAGSDYAYTQAVASKIANGTGLSDAPTWFGETMSSDDISATNALSSPPSTNSNGKKIKQSPMKITLSYKDLKDRVSQAAKDLRKAGKILQEEGIKFEQGSNFTADVEASELESLLSSITETLKEVMKAEAATIRADVGRFGRNEVAADLESQPKDDCMLTIDFANIPADSHATIGPKVGLWVKKITATAGSTKVPIERGFSEVERPRTEYYLNQIIKMTSSAIEKVPLLSAIAPRVVSYFDTSRKSCADLGLNLDKGAAVTYVKSFTSGLKVKQKKSISAWEAFKDWGDENFVDPAVKYYEDSKQNLEDSFDNPYDADAALRSLGKLCTMDEIYKEFFDKMDLPSMFCDYLKCIKLPGFELKLPSFHLPVIPKIPILGYYKHFLETIEEMFVEAITRLLCTFARTIIDKLTIPFCEDQLQEFIAAGSSATPLMNEALAASLTNTGITGGKEAEAKKFFEDSTKMLTGQELCHLLSGRTLDEPTMLVLSRLAQNAGVAMDLNSNESMVNFFGVLGVYLPSDVCEQLSRFSGMPKVATCKDTTDLMQAIRARLGCGDEVCDPEIQEVLDMAEKNMQDAREALAEFSDSEIGTQLPEFFNMSNPSASAAGPIPDFIVEDLQLASSAIFSNAETSYISALGNYVQAMNVPTLNTPKAGDPEYNWRDHLEFEAAVANLEEYQREMERVNTQNRFGNLNLAELMHDQGVARANILAENAAIGDILLSQAWTKAFYQQHLNYFNPDGFPTIPDHRLGHPQEWFNSNFIGTNGATNGRYGNVDLANLGQNSNYILSKFIGNFQDYAETDIPEVYRASPFDWLRQGPNLSSQDARIEALLDFMNATIPPQEDYLLARAPISVAADSDYSSFLQPMVPAGFDLNRNLAGLKVGSLKASPTAMGGLSGTRVPNTTVWQGVLEVGDFNELEIANKYLTGNGRTDKRIAIYPEENRSNSALPATDDTEYLTVEKLIDYMEEYNNKLQQLHQYNLYFGGSCWLIDGAPATDEQLHSWGVAEDLIQAGESQYERELREIHEARGRVLRQEQYVLDIQQEIDFRNAGSPPIITRGAVFRLFQLYDIEEYRPGNRSTGHYIHKKYKIPDNQLDTYPRVYFHGGGGVRGTVKDNPNMGSHKDQRPLKVSYDQVLASSINLKDDSEFGMYALKHLEDPPSGFNNNFWEWALSDKRLYPFTPAPPSFCTDDYTGLESIAEGATDLIENFSVFDRAWIVKRDKVVKSEQREFILSTALHSIGGQNPAGRLHADDLINPFMSPEEGDRPIRQGFMYAIAGDRIQFLSNKILELIEKRRNSFTGEHLPSVKGMLSRASEANVETYTTQLEGIEIPIPGGGSIPLGDNIADKLEMVSYNRTLKLGLDAGVFNPEIEMVEQTSGQLKDRYKISIKGDYFLRQQGSQVPYEIDFCDSLPDLHEASYPGASGYPKRNMFATIYAKRLAEDFSDQSLLDGRPKLQEELFKSTTENVMEDVLFSMHNSDMFDDDYARDLHSRVAGKTIITQECKTNRYSLAGSSILSFDKTILQNPVAEVMAEFTNPENDPMNRDFDDPTPFALATQTVGIKGFIRTCLIDLLLKGGIAYAVWDIEPIVGNKVFVDYAFNHCRLELQASKTLNDLWKPIVERITGLGWSEALKSIVREELLKLPNYSKQIFNPGEEVKDYYNWYFQEKVQNMDVATRIQSVQGNNYWKLSEPIYVKDAKRSFIIEHYVRFSGRLSTWAKNGEGELNDSKWSSSIIKAREAQIFSISNFNDLLSEAHRVHGEFPNWQQLINASNIHHGVRLVHASWKDSTSDFNFGFPTDAIPHVEETVQPPGRARQVSSRKKSYWMSWEPSGDTTTQEVDTRDELAFCVPLVEYERPINYETCPAVFDLVTSIDGFVGPIRPHIRGIEPLNHIEGYVPHANHDGKLAKHMVDMLLETADAKLLFDHIFPVRRFMTISTIFTTSVLAGYNDLPTLMDPTKTAIATAIWAAANERKSPSTSVGEFQKMLKEKFPGDPKDPSCFDFPGLNGDFFKNFLDDLANLMKMLPSVLLRGIANQIDPGYREMRQHYLNCDIKDLTWSGIRWETVDDSLVNGLYLPNKRPGTCEPVDRNAKPHPLHGQKAGKYAPIVPTMPVDFFASFSNPWRVGPRLAKTALKTVTYVFNGSAPFIDPSFLFKIPCLGVDTNFLKGEKYDAGAYGRYGHPITPFTALALSTFQLESDIDKQKGNCEVVPEDC